MTTGDLCDRFPELDRCTVMQHLKEIHDRWIHPQAVGAVGLLARLQRELEGGS
jgi:hypothetical protein